MGRVDDMMRARFKEASAEALALKDELEPIRARRDEMMKQVQAVEAQMRPFETRIQEISARIGPLEAECARLARALDGKTG